METRTGLGTMTRITLGRSGLTVSRLCFGTWQYGGDWGAQQETDAISAIHRARELGINFFDTAQGYGFGAAERILGRALRDAGVDLSGCRRSIRRGTPLQDFVDRERGPLSVSTPSP